MATVNDILLLALKKAGALGVGQNAQAEDISDAFTEANYLLAQWNRKRWLVYNLVDTAFTSTGALSYTVGAGQNFNLTARIDRLEFAYFRLLNLTGQYQVDYPLQLLQSREDYSRIALKSLSTWPSYAFLDSGYPVGNVYFWPVPPANSYELHIITKDVLAAFTTTAQVVNLPPEYEMALLYNLAVRLRISYQMPSDPALVALAQDAVNVLRNANAQVPALRLPTSLLRGGLYNIYSDQVY